MQEPVVKKVAIVGCRNFNDYDFLKQTILTWQKDNNIIISHVITGGARGVDTLAELFARNQNIVLIIKKANWERHGRSAGPRRNTEIVAECDLTLAFPSRTSTGTWDTVRKTEKAGKKCYVFMVPSTCF